jgi:predicted ATPase with chaperone activity
MIGGGQVPMPCDMSLTRNGIPFLDELPESRHHVIGVLH